jgi:hypothetical protein
LPGKTLEKKSASFGAIISKFFSLDGADIEKPPPMSNKSHSGSFLDFTI